MVMNRHDKGGGLQVLTACGDVDRTPSCYNDIVDKTRKRRCTANEESSDCAPIRTKFGRIAVDTMEPVHVRYRDIASAHNEVAVKPSAGIGITVGAMTDSVMRIDVIGPRKMV